MACDSTWIALSSSVILFNKHILDYAQFRKSSHRSNRRHMGIYMDTDRRFCVIRLPYVSWAMALYSTHFG